MSPSSQSSLAFPTTPSASIQSSNAESKLTCSDKLTELPSPTEGTEGTPRRTFRRSLDSLSTADSAPRISQVWGTIPSLRSLPQTSPTEGQDTPKQRVSFDSERRQVARSDIARNSVVQSASQPRSRASSPLRIFQHLTASLHRRGPEEPFIPINPFTFKCSKHIPFPSCCRSRSKKPQIPVPGRAATDSEYIRTRAFLTDTLPRQIYLHILLRLPALYFSRVARIFQDAEVSRPDIERMLEVATSRAAPRPTQLEDIFNPTGSPSEPRLPLGDDWTPGVVSPALIRFKHSWEDFVSSLIKEWKTLNVVSALLLSAILTLFQLPAAANDSLTRTAALISLVCGLMSLCYGCVYIVRFSTMGSMHRASKFAEEARKTHTLIWWNVWTLLAMPVVFLAWSVICFIVAISAFVWRTAPEGDLSDADVPAADPAVAREELLVQRVLVSCVLAIGLLYFALIVMSLKRYAGGPARVRVRVSDPEVGGGGGGREQPRGRSSLRGTARGNENESGEELKKVPTTTTGLV
ncbi:hypothetical protein MKEN_00301000 [Mycena kentingensis (nom. inval.)]|nr:hypothetical protein MKEN_00301000 [Mycena kentingensis (nom. inval.)]